jgi:hypothetical protein
MLRRGSNQRKRHEFGFYSPGYPPQKSHEKTTTLPSAYVPPHTYLSQKVSEIPRVLESITLFWQVITSVLRSLRLNVFLGEIEFASASGITWGNRVIVDVMT